MSEGTLGAMPGVAGERRLRQLEALFLGGPVVAKGQSFSIETLIDVLLVLYDECCSSSLRREKTVSDFIEFGKCIFYSSLSCVHICMYRLFLSLSFHLFQKAFSKPNLKLRLGLRIHDLSGLVPRQSY